MTKMSLKFEVYKPLVSMRGEGVDSPKNYDAIFEQPLTTSRVDARTRHNCITSSALFCCLVRLSTGPGKKWELILVSGTFRKNLQKMCMKPILLLF